VTALRAALLLLVGQWALAYLVLDLCFRTMDVRPEGLRTRVRRYGLAYGALGVASALLAGWGQARLAGGGGLPLAALSLLPWWLLWRFGLRKQLTFLFKHDGGRDHQGG
jgi:hypothetical protein